MYSPPSHFGAGESVLRDMFCLLIIGEPLAGLFFAAQNKSCTTVYTVL